MHTWTRSLALALLLVLGTAGAEQAGDDFKVEPGYTLLFNGKDLSGWKYLPTPKEGLDGKTETADQRFSVQDGAIVAAAKDKAGKGGIKDLYTTRDFPNDFHLKLEFRAGEKADSGVYLRGKQLQVRDYLRRGEQRQLTRYKNDGWNELDITVQGTEATCLLNGEALTPPTMAVPAKGGIGVQAETGKFEFRRIRVKELK